MFPFIIVVLTSMVIVFCSMQEVVADLACSKKFAEPRDEPHVAGGIATSQS